MARARLHRASAAIVIWQKNCHVINIWIVFRWSFYFLFVQFFRVICHPNGQRSTIGKCVHFFVLTEEASDASSRSEKSIDVPSNRDHLVWFLQWMQSTIRYRLYLHLKKNIYQTRTKQHWGLVFSSPHLDFVVLGNKRRASRTSRSVDRCTCIRNNVTQQ